MMGEGAGKLPLAGKRVVVTRSRSQASEFAALLSSYGAEVLYVPTIRVEPLIDQERVTATIGRLQEFDWIIFTSVNGVSHFLDACFRQGAFPSNGRLARARTCAIGPVTASALQDRGVHPDLVPARYVAEAVVEAFQDVGGLAGAQVLLPRAESGRILIPRVLTELGAHVVDLPVYRTVPEADSADTSLLDPRSARVDVLTFASGSAARNFATYVSPSPGTAVVASIGPVTSAVIRELGWGVDIEAAVHTLEGLCEAIVSFYAAESRG